MTPIVSVPCRRNELYLVGFLSLSQHLVLVEVSVPALPSRNLHHPSCRWVGEGTIVKKSKSTNVDQSAQIYFQMHQLRRYYLTAMHAYYTKLLFHLVCHY